MCHESRSRRVAKWTATVLAVLPIATAAQEPASVAYGSVVRIGYSDPSGVPRTLTGAFGGIEGETFRISHRKMFGMSHEAIPRHRMTRLEVCDGCSETRDQILGMVGMTIGWTVGMQLFKGDGEMGFSGSDGASWAGAMFAMAGMGLVGRQISKALEEWTDVPVDVGVAAPGHASGWGSMEIGVQLPTR